MIEQGRGCRFCEVEKSDFVSLEHKFNKEMPSHFGLTDASYKICRCNKCGSYWSVYTIWDSDHIPTPLVSWFCFGRDVDNIKSFEDLYQKTEQPKCKWWRVDWLTVPIIIAMVILIYMFFYSWTVNLSSKRYDTVAIEEPLTFTDINVMVRNTTVIDFRNGYLTNHTVILIMEDNSVVQYGVPKNICYTSNTISIANP